MKWNKWARERERFVTWKYFRNMPEAKQSHKYPGIPRNKTIAETFEYPARFFLIKQRTSYFVSHFTPTHRNNVVTFPSITAGPP